MQVSDLVRYPSAVYIFSNEIVFRGHPDKVCDQISDAILDVYLARDRFSRCAIEVVGGKQTIFITGEVTSTAKGEIDHQGIALRVMRDIGYRNYSSYNVIDNIGSQSPDIAKGTNEEVGGAGDQGMMFGYACNDTGKFLPTAQCILQDLADAYDDLVYSGLPDGTRGYLPDGKAQITGLYDKKGKLLRIKTFVISFQNKVVSKEHYDSLVSHLTDTALDICSEYGQKVDKFIINNTGTFEIGGFEGDAGLTGRKIIVDTYQGFARHGGGAFSGKDPSKVDRSGAYMARYIARSIVASGCAEKCEVQLSYVIGSKEPLGVYVNTFETGKLDDRDLASFIKTNNDLTPQGIRKTLGLLDTLYEPLARFGHFGHETLWEKKNTLTNLLNGYLKSTTT